MEQSVIYRRLLFFFFKVLCVPHWHLTRNILSTTIFFVQLDFFIQPITELSGDHTATLVLFLQLSLCCWHRVSLLRHLSSMFLDKVRRQESKSCITNKMRKQLSHCVTKYTSSSQLFMARHITFLLFVWVCTCVRQTAGTCVRYSWNWFSPISNSRCFLLRIAEWHKRKRKRSFYIVNLIAIRCGCFQATLAQCFLLLLLYYIWSFYGKLRLHVRSKVIDVIINLSVAIRPSFNIQNPIGCDQKVVDVYVCNFDFEFVSVLQRQQ